MYIYPFSKEANIFYWMAQQPVKWYKNIDIKKGSGVGSGMNSPLNRLFIDKCIKIKFTSNGNITHAIVTKEGLDYFKKEFKAKYEEEQVEIQIRAYNRKRKDLFDELCVFSDKGHNKAWNDLFNKVYNQDYNKLAQKSSSLINLDLTIGR